MISRLASFVTSGAALVSISVACSGTTDSRSQNGGLGTDAGTGGSSTGGASASGGRSSQNGGASSGGRAAGGSSAGGNAGSSGAAAGGNAGSGAGAAPAGGSQSTGGSGGTAGRSGSGGSTGGAQGGAPTDGGPCNLCLPTYDLHWGQNGGLVAWVEASRLGPCASYTHERTPTFTDPPSLVCTATISACPGSPLAQIIDAMGTAAFNAALTGHTLYGNDPRPVDGQVFRISIGNDFIDVGPNCENDPTSCPNMPEPVRRLVTLLRDLDAAALAVEPCKSVFGS
jgi:hypothetical protein